jgi:hypothetical protein
MQSESIVPGRTEQLAADAAFAGILAEHRGRHATQHAQVFRCRAVLEPTVVLPEHHIQDPVQTIFDAPMPSHQTQQFLGVGLAAIQAGYPPNHLDFLLALTATHTLQLEDLGRSGPIQVAFQQGRAPDLPILATTVPLVGARGGLLVLALALELVGGKRPRRRATRPESAPSTRVGCL